MIYKYLNASLIHANSDSFFHLTLFQLIQNLINFLTPTGGKKTTATRMKFNHPIRQPISHYPAHTHTHTHAGACEKSDNDFASITSAISRARGPLLITRTVLALSGTYTRTHGRRTQKSITTSSSPIYTPNTQTYTHSTP